MNDIGGALRTFESRHIDVSGHITVLGAENGDVLVWRGRNLGGDGRRIGPDRCR